MIICWDNLEKMNKYVNNEWFHINTHRYIYKDNCKNCGEPFLSEKYNNDEFCSRSCSQKGKLNNFNTFNKTVETDKSNHSQWKGGYVTNNISTYDEYAPQINWCEEVRRNSEDKNILEVKCAYCGKWYIPTYISIWNRILALNGQLNNSESRLYCSENCKQECPIYNQKVWPKGFKLATSREIQPELRQMVLKRDNYTCQKCNKHQDKLKTGLHCHHLEGIRWEPLESADMDKCITLCKDCHKAVHKLPDCGYNDLKCKEGF